MHNGMTTPRSDEGASMLAFGCAQPERRKQNDEQKDQHDG
jgi:hypothetical protein